MTLDIFAWAFSCKDFFASKDIFAGLAITCTDIFAAKAIFTSDSWHVLIKKYLKVKLSLVQIYLQVKIFLQVTVRMSQVLVKISLQKSYHLYRYLCK